MDLKKITLILSLALFAQHANAMESSFAKASDSAKATSDKSADENNSNGEKRSQEQDISSSNKKVKQNQISLTDILPIEIISLIISWCIDLSQDENALAKNIASLLRVNKSFNELINQYPEILKIVINRFEQIKKNYFAQHNLNYDFMTHRLTPNAKTLLAKTKLLSKIYDNNKNKEKCALITKAELNKDLLLHKHMHNSNRDQAKLIVWLALCNGAKVDGLEERPLWDALTECRNDIVQLLIDKGCDLNYPSDSSSLASAINLADRDEEALAERGTNSQEFKQVIYQMIEKGADVNSIFHYGESCLVLARYDIELMKKLLEKGANVFYLIPNYYSSYNVPLYFKTAYDVALSENKKEAAEFLLKEMNRQCIENNNDQKINCTICLKEINFDSEVGFKLPCNHIFHQTCITDHIQKNCPQHYYIEKPENCPTCKAKLEIPNQPNCAICLAEFTNEPTKLLNCGHKFHEDCINLWLQDHNFCPYCKKQQ